MGGFSLVTDDILQNILSRLPALSFASAACVNKCWNKVCSRILSCPKLASALSLNPYLPLAVSEVVDKVLSQPIRPHFAIAFICLQFNLQLTHQLITQKLSSTIPVITSVASGIIGPDAVTDELTEARWEVSDGPIPGEPPTIPEINWGIVLVVGFVPGLKVDAVPLLSTQQEPQRPLVDKFLMDIMDFTASVSGSRIPAGIMLFGGESIDMRPVLAEIDYAMPEETVIVGDTSGCFLWMSPKHHQHYNGGLYNCNAVGLVFAKDKDKPEGAGEIQFHVTLSMGIIPFGRQLQVASVTEKDVSCSLITARMEGHHEILDGQGLIDDIDDETGNEWPNIYIGVIKQRESSSESENLGSGRYLAFYQVAGGEDDNIIVDGFGIKPGDSFRFYYSDYNHAKLACVLAHKDLRLLKAALSNRNQPRRVMGGAGVFGGFIFSSYCRDESLFGHSVDDCFPFCENFRRTPVAGLYGEGGVGPLLTTNDGEQSDNEGISVRCCRHVCSAVYLAMSYLPPVPE